jgi:hypothetical protein
VERLVRRPTLTAPARVGSCNTAGRGEETGFQIEQRNRSRKQEREIAALKPLDNEKPIQAAVSAASTDRPVFHSQQPYRCTAANWRLGPKAAVSRYELRRTPQTW